MAYASASDVEIELGRPATSADETAQIEQWLDRVERTIRSRFTRLGFDLDEQIELGLPTIDQIIDVEIARVAEKVNNPSGYTSTTRSVDDASVTTRREGIETGDGLTITDAEWAAILPTPPKRSKAFSLMPS